MRWFLKRMTVSLGLPPLQNLTESQPACSKGQITVWTITTHISRAYHITPSRAYQPVWCCFSSSSTWRGCSGMDETRLLWWLLSTLPCSQAWYRRCLSHENSKIRWSVSYQNSLTAPRGRRTYWSSGHWYWDSTGWFANHLQRCMSPGLSWQKSNVYDMRERLRKPCEAQQQWYSLGVSSEEAADVIYLMVVAVDAHHRDGLILRRRGGTFQTPSRVWLFCLRRRVMLSNNKTP